MTRQHKGSFRPHVEMYSSDSDNDDPASNLPTVEKDMSHSSDNLLDDSDTSNESAGSTHRQSPIIDIQPKLCTEDADNQTKLSADDIQNKTELSTSNLDKTNMCTDNLDNRGRLSREPEEKDKDADAANI